MNNENINPEFNNGNYELHSFDNSKMQRFKMKTNQLDFNASSNQISSTGNGSTSVINSHAVVISSISNDDTKNNKNNNKNNNNNNNKKPENNNNNNPNNNNKTGEDGIKNFNNTNPSPQ